MRSRSKVFVDTGAWIALALRRDPFHARALQAWEEMAESHARIVTSVPVVLETVTFIDRHAARDVALQWKDSLDSITDFRVLACTEADMREAWQYYTRRDLHKLSAVDATSFVLMSKHGIGRAFSFDHHFASVGFSLVG